MLTVGYNPTHIELPFGLTLNCFLTLFGHVFASAERLNLTRPVQCCKAQVKVGITSGIYIDRLQDNT